MLAVFTQTNHFTSCAHEQGGVLSDGARPGQKGRQDVCRFLFLFFSPPCPSGSSTNPFVSTGLPAQAAPPSNPFQANGRPAAGKSPGRGSLSTSERDQSVHLSVCPCEACVSRTPVARGVMSYSGHQKAEQDQERDTHTHTLHASLYQDVYYRMQYIYCCP